MHMWLIKSDFVLIGLLLASALVTIITLSLRRCEVLRSVCLSVHTDISETTCHRVTKFLVAVTQWLWLSPPLAVFGYVMYTSGCMDDVTVLHNIHKVMLWRCTCFLFVMSDISDSATSCVNILIFKQLVGDNSVFITSLSIVLFNCKLTAVVVW